MGVNILSKLQLPSFNGFGAMMNMNEYEYIKKIIDVSMYKCVNVLKKKLIGKQSLEDSKA